MTTNNSTNNSSGGRWITYLNNAPYSMSMASACSIGNNTIWLSGGQGAGYNTSIYIYNSLTDSWTTCASGTPVIMSHATIFDGTYYWIFGGRNGQFSYDYRTNQLIRTKVSDQTQVSNLGGTNLGTISSVGIAYNKFNKKVYISGGTWNYDYHYNFLISCDISNPDSPVWGSYSDLAAVPVASGKIYNHSMCVTQDGKYLYVFGGNVYTSFSSAVYRYTISSNTWDTMTPMPYVTSQLSPNACILGNYVYIFGGYTQSGTYLNKAIVYNIHNDSWDWLPPLPQGISSMANDIVSGPHGSYAYIITGQSSSSAINTNYAFKL